MMKHEQIIEFEGPILKAEYEGPVLVNFGSSDELLGVDEVAQRLGVPKGTVYELTRNRADVRGVPIPHFKIGKRLKFNWSAVVQWVDSIEKGEIV